MSIRTISTGQLRRMGDQEGLVLQGCGGDPQEWVDGINEILAQEGILKKGAGFEEAYTFRHDGLTCMLFPFNGGSISNEKAVLLLLLIRSITFMLFIYLGGQMYIKNSYVCLPNMLIVYVV